MSPRWTTARAVSAGADLRSRVAVPTWVPSKESTGRVANSERTKALNGNFVLWDLKKQFSLEEAVGVEMKIEEEKKAIDEGEAAA